MVLQSWIFISYQTVKDGISELLWIIECPRNVCMVVQPLKFINITNINDGILELLLEIECPHTLCMVQQSLKPHKNQKG